MNLVVALAVAALFGSGVYLMLKRDLIRVVVGINLMSNAVNLFIVAAGLFRGGAPIFPPPEDQQFSDPLVQSLALTAIVISFGISALVLTLIYRIYTSHDSLDQHDLRLAEENAVAEMEQEAEVLWR